MQLSPRQLTRHFKRATTHHLSRKAATTLVRCIRLKLRGTSSGTSQMGKVAGLTS